MPVKAGLASGALSASRTVTYSVVASLVLESAASGVGAVGMPVKAGLASGALLSRPSFSHLVRLAKLIAA